jgi:hypothetical protein
MIPEGNPNTEEHPQNHILRRRPGEDKKGQERTREARRISE